jgi:hypothetical protein
MVERFQHSNPNSPKFGFAVREANRRQWTWSRRVIRCSDADRAPGCSADCGCWRAVHLHPDPGLGWRRPGLVRGRPTDPACRYRRAGDGWQLPPESTLPVGDGGAGERRLGRGAGSGYRHESSGPRPRERTRAAMRFSGRRARPAHSSVVLLAEGGYQLRNGPVIGATTPVEAQLVALKDSSTRRACMRSRSSIASKMSITWAFSSDG